MVRQTYHNESGLFCRSCGERFSQAVINSLRIPTLVQMEAR
jgi:hypothetical protein